MKFHRMVNFICGAWLITWFMAAGFCAGSNPEFHLLRSFQGPNLAHPFGFDAFGRDLLVTLLRSSSLSAGFALAATGITIFLAIIIGSSMALAPQNLRFYLLRLLDLALAFPSILIALSLAAVMGPGWGTLTIALAVGIIPPFVRLVYVRCQELLAEDYVLAARSLGANPRRILSHHLGPPLLSLCSIKAPTLFAHALMAEATLSFMGVGAPIGRDTWGALLAQAKDYLIEAPHIAIGTGIPLVLTVLALQAVSKTDTSR